MKFIVVLVIMLSTTFGAVITLDNIQEFLPAEHETVAEYVTENLDTFKTEWNTRTENEEEKFNGTSVEYTRVVSLPAGGDATYIDFDGNNGFLVLADKYTLLSFEVKGDMPWIRSSADAYFSEYSGIYTKQADSEEFLDPTNAANAYYGITEDDIIDASLMGRVGQESPNGGGWSRIYAPISYLRDLTKKNDWTYKSYNDVDNYTSYHTGDEFSMYRRYDNVTGMTTLEGNCVITAFYNTIEHYNKVRHGSRVNTNFFQMNDPYKDYFTPGAKNKGYFPYKKAMPSPYITMRDYAVNNLGYTYEGMDDKNVHRMREAMLMSFFTLLSVVKSNVNIDTIINNVNNNIVTVLGWNDRLAIGGKHATTIVDYTLLTRTSGWWIFKTTENRVFIGGADGLARNVNVNKRYIDWTGYIANNSYNIMWTVK